MEQAKQEHHHDHHPFTCVVFMCNTRERNGGGAQTLSVPAVGSGGGPRCWSLPEPMYNVTNTNKEVDHSSLFFCGKFYNAVGHQELDACSLVLKYTARNISVGQIGRVHPTPVVLPSYHEIQAVFTLIRKHVKEKDRPREPRRGANVMPVAAAKENRPKVKELSKLSKVKVVEIKSCL
ncbi:hypothetical protein NC651_026531 [Populus alba x Populus x berolinensis]|nr:hypothetical protein NC651_026531 [Populus alba x Populus x berolinensis]